MGTGFRAEIIPHPMSNFQITALTDWAVTGTGQGALRDELGPRHTLWGSCTSLKHRQQQPARSGCETGRPRCGGMGAVAPWEQWAGV